MFNYILNKKDTIFASFGVLILIGSVLLIGFGIKKSLERKSVNRANHSVVQEEDKEDSDSPESKKNDKDKKREKQKEKEDSEDEPSVVTKTPEDSEPAPSKDGVGIIEVPSKPGKDPEKEDIDQVVISGSKCEPQSVEVAKDRGLVLEVTAEDKGYLFQVEEIGVEEQIAEGQTTNISIPSYLVSDLNKVSFQCSSLD